MIGKLFGTIRQVLQATASSHYYNDPSTPDLFGPVEVPVLVPGIPRFTVNGWTGAAAGEPGSPEFQATQVYVTLATCLNYVQRLNPGGPLLHRWSSTPNLMVYPRAGEQLNAYYDRSSLRFFYSKNGSDKMIYTCESVDVVAHELGHAILDSFRPDLWTTAVMEVFAFHEAFGDVMAMATVLQSPLVVGHVLAETANDLHKPNVASRIGEEMGRAYYTLSGGRMGGTNYLRNACNDLAYQSPESLPAHGGDGVLSKEPHNFSRVFTGAWYECLAEVFQALLAAGTPPPEAMRTAVNRMVLVLLLATNRSPSNARFFQTVCGKMLEVEAQLGGQFGGQMRAVLTRRRLVEAVGMGHTLLSMAPPLDTVHLDPSVEGRCMRVADMVVDLPHYGTAGERGEVTAGAARDCVNFIRQHRLVGGERDMFTMRAGRLHRNYICCAFEH